MSLSSFCEEPKDHVSGILNLIPHRIQNLIAIDYNATEDQVFQQAVAACVFECGDLDILCFSELSTAFESASTPNFCQGSTTQLFESKGCGGQTVATRRERFYLGQPLASTSYCGATFYVSFSFKPPQRSRRCG
jgi:hypothetical protein